MTWFSAALTFVVIWWLVLFIVLPFGASPPQEVQPGTAPSAPARPRMLLKLLITTVIALALTAGAMWIVESGLISLRPPG
jgi:predicted secreted protein